MSSMRRYEAVAFLAAIGCSGGGDAKSAEGDGPLTDEVPAGATGTGGGSASDPVPVEPEVVEAVTAPPPGEWTRLIAASWELEPGDEGYWCRRVTVADDIWIGSYRAIAPVGTHHTTLGKDSGGPDGTFRCGGFSTGTELLFGSGVGTDAVTFPAGVAVKVAAGEQLLLNLHVYNTSIELLSELSGVEIVAVDPADVEHEVAFVLAGLAGGLTVVPGESTQTGRCTLPAETTILSAGAHVHTRGIHQRVAAYPTPDTPIVLTDAPYDFQEQGGVWFDVPVVVPAGGHVEVTCTYLNDSPETLGFGEGTDDEMCYAGLFHYPRFQSGSTCVR